MVDDTLLLYLVTPLLSEVEAFAAGLAEALDAAPVAAVLLRLDAADERTLVNRVKAVAAATARRDVALMVSLPDGADGPLVAARGGADGLHVSGPGRLAALRGALRDRSLGVAGLRTRDDAMAAGEGGADYLMFGEPRPDGYVPPLDATAERAAWWAEIFETPCVAYAATPEAVAVLAETGAEFVAIGDWLWSDERGVTVALKQVADDLAAARASVPA